MNPVYLPFIFPLSCLKQGEKTTSRTQLRSEPLLPDAVDEVIHERLDQWDQLLQRIRNALASWRVGGVGTQLHQVLERIRDALAS